MPRRLPFLIKSYLRTSESILTVGDVPSKVRGVVLGDARVGAVEKVFLKLEEVAAIEVDREEIATAENATATGEVATTVGEMLAKCYDVFVPIEETLAKDELEPDNTDVVVTFAKTAAKANDASSIVEMTLESVKKP
ncbi:hypothetical protein HDU67_005828 [Dinochytrium kinnereticum]|nr:hypothetical protein HDU67_005828 [Dinochytrium kinnereticum]